MQLPQMRENGGTDNNETTAFVFDGAAFGRASLHGWHGGRQHSAFPPAARRTEGRRRRTGQAGDPLGPVGPLGSRSSGFLL